MVCGRGGSGGCGLRWLVGVVVVLVVLLVGCVGVAWGGVGSVGCSGCSAWWHGLSVSRPSDLRGGVARSGVQELVVDATGGDVVLVEPASLEFFEKGRISFEELRLVEFPYDASVGVVQGAVERLFPGDAVEVSGRVGRYVLTFPGQSVARIDSAFGFLGGLVGEATVNVVAQGQPDGELLVTFENVGDATVDAAVSPVEVQDVLPAGLRAVSVSGGVPEGEADGERTFVPIACRLGSGSLVGCTAEGSYTSVFGHVVGEIVPPFDVVKLRVGVIVEGSAVSGEVNRASVSGGGTPGASVGFPVTISSSPAAFGVEDYGLVNEEAGGGVDAQAGSHPFQQTTTLAFNTSSADEVSASEPALTKDVNVLWPPGLIGDPVPFPRCSLAEFFTKSCPAESIVGVGVTAVDEPGANSTGVLLVDVPLYDVEPAPGEAARFGMLPANVPVFIDATVRTGGDYGVTVHVQNVTQVVTFLSSEVTVWGTPGAAVHDAQRGEGCLLESRGASELQVLDDEFEPCKALEESDPPPFLTLPTACTGELETSVETDSWQEPRPEGDQVKRAFEMPGLDGCNRLPFTPSITVKPDLASASSPSGLTVDEHVPQESTLDASGLAQAAVKGLSVTLPEGVQINPSAGDGLQACSEEQIGLRSPAASACPQAAKVATVKVKVPVLADPLEGAAYVATQNENPFGSLMAMYIYAEDPVSGVRVKAAGEVVVSPDNGQLTAHFARDPAFDGQGETSEFLPQAPFEDVELHFFGGERAPLATPAHCGTYTTTGTFTPWSASPSDEAAVTVPSSSSFQITSGPHASSCPPAGSLPFSPSMTAGTLNINAGQYTPLTTTVIREDGEASISRIQIHMPDGIEGILAGVELCEEPAADNGSCPPESKIGETTVSAGVGQEPVAVKGGEVFLTKGYDGAPFGLSIKNPVKAGPFDLEHDTNNPANDPPCDCLVVRARIEVSPETGELTITSNSEAEGHAIPHIIDGIPVQLKRVNVLVNRERFTFNPTSCSPLAITATLTSTLEQQTPLTVPFQAANCSLLRFTPELKVTTPAQGSKANGTSLTFDIRYPQGAMGSQTWLQEAKFDIPKQLPARLSTIQKACLAHVFETDRGACPPASIIGHAIVHTQVLPVPLEGPLYFVSYGSAKFPDAVLVLQGYGITIEQHGETFINNKTGITSATFRSIPDVPFETLEVNVPAGPNSEFGVNLPTKDKYNYCTQKLTMPTLFKAANGTTIHQTTPITITGCHTKHKTKHKTKHTTKHKTHT